MTKISKSGVTKNRHHESKNLDSHLGDRFETVGGEKWTGQEIEVHSDPLMDSGRGKPVIMRFFEFKLSPDMIKYQKPLNQELFNAHATQIKAFLWKDGLVPYEFLEPRIIWSKKKDGFRIMVACEPRPGVILAETPQTLQQITNPHAI